MTHERLGPDDIIKEGDELYVHELRDWENVFFPKVNSKVGLRTVRREKVIKDKVKVKKARAKSPRKMGVKNIVTANKVEVGDMIEIKGDMGSLHKVIAVSYEFNQAYIKKCRVLFVNISRVYREVR